MSLGPRSTSAPAFSKERARIKDSPGCDSNIALEMNVLLAVALQVTPSTQDRRNIALSTAIVQRVGDRLWPTWSKTPFAIDLLTAGGPVAINFPKPFPAPSFPKQLEATFPLGNGVPTIVIGEPQFTAAKTPIRWSVTLLHEHFHQWQYSWPQYQAGIRALDLAPKGSSSGMWMLDYPFPYKDARIDRVYSRLAAGLAAAVQAIGTPHFSAEAAAYVSERKAFKAALKPSDYRYFAFQCWQEGVARYTEIAVARLAAETHARESDFLTQAQADGLAHDSRSTYHTVLRQLRTASLAQDRRLNFYAVGAAEALVLDRLAAGWRLRYLDKRMDLGDLFPSPLQ